MKYIPYLIIIIIPFIFYFFKRRNALLNDIGKNDGTVLNKKKTNLWMYILVVTLMLAMTLTDASYSLKRGVYLQVRTVTREYSNYNSFKLSNNNQFNSGLSGELHWHPKNFAEALLLNGTGTFGVLTIFDVVLLYIVVGIFYLMTLGAGKKSVFSRNLTYGFMLIFFLIAMSGTLKDMEYSWISAYIETITNRQFKLQKSNSSPFLYLQWGAMLFFMLRFAQQALDMQKEQELTI